MIIWFNTEGAQVGASSREDAFAFDFEVTKVTVNNFDPSKQYRLENGEVTSSDIPVIEEDPDVIRLIEIEKARRSAYPMIEHQLDKLYHDIANGTLDQTGEFFTALKAVKDANPKP